MANSDHTNSYLHGHSNTHSNAREDHASSENSLPYTNVHANYFYGGQQHFHLRGPTYTAPFTQDGNINQRHGVQSLRPRMMIPRELPTPLIRPEHGTASRDEYTLSRGTSHQPSMPPDGNQNPLAIEIVDDLQDDHAAFQDRLTSHETALTNGPTNIIPWELFEFDPEFDRRQPEQYLPSGFRLDQPSCNHRRSARGSLNEEVTCSERNHEAKNMFYDATYQVLSDTPATGTETRLASMSTASRTLAQASMTQRSNSTISAPAIVARKKRKIGRASKYQVLSDVMTIPLPASSHVQLRYNTRSDASQAFRERTKLLPTYWTPPINDVSIPQNDADRQNIVRTLVAAMKDLSRARDPESPLCIGRWAENAPRKHDDEEIEIACWEIVELTERLHREGPSVLNIRDATYLNKARCSEALTFADRIHYIVVLLWEFKSRCDGMIKGGTLHTVVSAPQEALHTSRSNLKNNQIRQEDLEEGRKAKEERHRKQIEKEGGIEMSTVSRKRKRSTEKHSAPSAAQSAPNAGVSAEFPNDQESFTDHEPSLPLQPQFAKTDGPIPTSQSSSAIQQKRLCLLTNGGSSPRADVKEVSSVPPADKSTPAHEPTPSGVDSFVGQHEIAKLLPEPQDPLLAGNRSSEI